MLAVSRLAADSRNQVFSDFTTPLPLPAGSTLVIGVVGGWERWDAPQRIVRRVALRLRDRRAPGVWIETVENHKIELAEQLIRRAFPDPPRARILLFGHSLGGSVAVRFARRLHELGYPVHRLVVIDAIGKDSRRIPPNVASALNLYQRDSWPVAGQSRIEAEDPRRTVILGNRRFSYWGKHIDMETEPWVRRVFTRGHLKMEYDPEVWRAVEDALLEEFARIGVR